jgi:hypothetical protein
MKQKILITIGFISIMIAGLIPTDVFAANANVYVSPGSSSVTVGGYVTVAVRVSSDSSPMDSVQANLNFNSSLLQYSSYSGGYFKEFKSGLVGSAFTYTGALLGSSTMSDQQMFAVTFKAIASGTASLSISGASVAYSGTALAVSASGGSVAISAPASTPPPTTSTPPSTKTSTTTKTTTTNTATKTTTATATPTATADTTAPKLVANPVVSKGLNTITLKFNTDEKAKIQTIYTLGKTVKTLDDNTLATNHSISIGSSTPLIAGTTYDIQIIATDASGNKATIYNQDIRTNGINYTVRIMDQDGQPLANHAVQIHSDPINGTTDANGYVTFKNMTPGEHTLIFTIDGLTLRQPVTIAQQSTGSKLLPTATDTNASIKLPIRFAETSVSNPISNGYQLFVGVALIIIGIVTILSLRFKRFREIFIELLNKFKKPKSKLIVNQLPSPPVQD